MTVEHRAMTTGSPNLAWPTASCCPVLELRQYTLHPDQREVLIEVFDREFVEPQEELGTHVVGQFRDLDNPDRFVWLRGFTDMERRRAALSGFYGGPVWAAHKDVANATMIDSDDVLLLRPTSPEDSFPVVAEPRRPVGSTDRPPSLIVATVYALAAPVTPEFLDLFTRRVEPLLMQAGSSRLAALQTEPAQNTYPALPVREGEYVFVRFSRFDSVEAYAAHLDRLGREPGWDEVRHELKSRLIGSPQRLRLQPTARSLLQ